MSGAARHRAPTWVGLIAFSAGSALWLFPYLPAVAARTARPHFLVSAGTGLTLSLAGMAILALSREKPRRPRR